MARILIVDDFPDVHILIQAMLDRDGHEVVGKALTSNDAVRLFEDTAPDVVLLDLVLPGESGAVCMERLLKIDAKARIIVVTGAPPHSNVYRAVLEAGAAHILPKPINPEQLRETIERVLSGAPAAKGEPERG